MLRVIRPRYSVPPHSRSIGHTSGDVSKTKGLVRTDVRVIPVNVLVGCPGAGRSLATWIQRAGSLRIPRSPYKGYSFAIFSAPCGYAIDAFDSQWELTCTVQHKPVESLWTKSPSRDMSGGLE